MPKSHGTGKFSNKDFNSIGKNVCIEDGVQVFHPETITIGDNVYIGHQTILKGYYKGKMIIGNGTWIGQQCFLHSAGNIIVGENVGIGPSVKIITSFHKEEGIDRPILHSELEFKSVVIKNDSDIGVGSILLPGVVVGKGVLVGAGSVVTRNIPDNSVVAGSPARLLRNRKING